MKSILVVDDDESTLDMVRTIAEGAGYDVRSAAGGKEALEAISHRKPDLVLLDIMMPEVPGIAVCHRIKSDKALEGIKVVMLTAKAFSADRHQAEEAGADDYLVKPVSKKQLLDTLKTHLAAL